MGAKDRAPEILTSEITADSQLPPELSNGCSLLRATLYRASRPHACRYPRHSAGVSPSPCSTDLFHLPPSRHYTPFAPYWGPIFCSGVQ